MHIYRDTWALIIKIKVIGKQAKKSPCRGGSGELTAGSLNGPLDRQRISKAPGIGGTSRMSRVSHQSRIGKQEAAPANNRGRTTDNAE
jgi:hypothetical protein